MPQIVVNGAGSMERLPDVLGAVDCEKLLLVCTKPARYYPAGWESICGIPTVPFSEFSPNPIYEDITRGVELFCAESCDAILAIGGGSAIDVAKCIKLFCRMDKNKCFLDQPFEDTCIPLITVPTTAGTGSESTRHAVCYYEGNKQSISHNSILPDYAILDPTLLKSLPVYQRKCTMLDALCQGIESWWSVNSTAESIAYARKAVALITEYWRAYIDGGSQAAAKEIMEAANMAGRAINITATTAAHAMSYKLTSLYTLPHGHAVAVCLPHVWRYMTEHPDMCIDPRGEKHMNRVFSDIGVAMGCDTEAKAIALFSEMLKQMGIGNPNPQSAEDIDMLVRSVNPVRLKNNPVALSENVLRDLYEIIVS